MLESKTRISGKSDPIVGKKTKLSECHFLFSDFPLLAFQVYLTESKKLECRKVKSGGGHGSLFFIEGALEFLIPPPTDMTILVVWMYFLGTSLFEKYSLWQSGHRKKRE